MVADLEINPLYASSLQRMGVTRAEQLLDRPAVVVSGHPDRHVCRMLLEKLEGSSSDAPAAQRLVGYLKREHCARWKEHFRSALQGFGFVSKTRRETLVLQAAAHAGISCPEWIAAGRIG